MGKFKTYSRKQFEYNLIKIRKENDLPYWCDYTEEMRVNLDGMLNERVYMFNTNRFDVKLLIYSSVDLETDLTRDYSSDAIRVVYMWKTKNGILYKHISKHLRIDTLFDNLEITLIENCIVIDSDLKSGWQSEQKIAV